MTSVSNINSDIYQHNFSVNEARALISSCLDKFDKHNPDSLILLKAISKLTVMINMAEYDYTVLENLISENKALGKQYQELKARLNQSEPRKSASKPFPVSTDPRLPHHLSMTELDSNNANVNLRLISI